jgi:hypothetical protein
MERKKEMEEFLNRRNPSSYRFQSKSKMLL